MISYAQNFEDVMLARVFAGLDQGFYIDIGAMDPTYFSVTKHFYDLGWSGLNAEPNSLYYERLVRERQRDVNLAVAVGSAPGIRRFYEFHELGISSFDPAVKDHFAGRGLQYVERDVPVTTLESLCEQYVRSDIHFLKIDVEGWEAEVVKGANWKKYRPIVVIIEALAPHTRLPSHSSWEHYLIQRGYCLVYFDGLNRFYLREEDAQLKNAFTCPPNDLDGFELWATVSARERASVLEKLLVEEREKRVAAESLVAGFRQRDVLRDHDSSQAEDMSEKSGEAGTDVPSQAANQVYRDGDRNDSAGKNKIAELENLHWMARRELHLTEEKAKMLEREAADLRRTLEVLLADRTDNPPFVQKLTDTLENWLKEFGRTLAARDDALSTRVRDHLEKGLNRMEEQLGARECQRFESLAGVADDIRSLSEQFRTTFRELFEADRQAKGRHATLSRRNRALLRLLKQYRNRLGQREESEIRLRERLSELEATTQSLGAEVLQYKEALSKAEVARSDTTASLSRTVDELAAKLKAAEQRIQEAEDALENSQSSTRVLAEQIARLTAENEGLRDSLTMAQGQIQEQVKEERLLRERVEELKSSLDDAERRLRNTLVWAGRVSEELSALRSRSGSAAGR